MSKTIRLTPHGKTDGWIWVQSDLQLAQPGRAISVLGNAVRDTGELDIELDGVWCLGDALCGVKEADLEEVATASIDLLESLGVPVVYLLGNHEMDVRQTSGRNVFPILERTAGRPLWHVQPDLDDFYFERMCFGTRVFFMGDHADRRADGKWFVQHHRVKGDGYPHTDASWNGLRESIRAASEPVLTVSHYAYPGGQRPGELIAQLLPLPDTVVTHLHGHAHIGDMVWNSERPYQRKNPIDGTAVKQYNISALEDVRSPGSHTAFLRFESGVPAEIRIRCHHEKRWVETFSIGSAEAPVSPNDWHVRG